MATYSQKLREQKRLDTDRLMNLLSRFSIHIVIILLSLGCLFPLLLIVSASFTDEIALTRFGYNLIPTQFSTDAYAAIFRTPGVIIRAYLVTIFTTVVGTILALALMSPLAYALSRPDFILRKPLSLFVFFTMLFSGGIVPYYILMTQYLRVQDTVLALILPYLVVVYYVLILRTYFAALPSELIDAARVDGAGEFRIFISIALPLAKPALATIALFTALNYWNDWTTALYFVRDPQFEFEGGIGADILRLGKGESIPAGGVKEELRPVCGGDDRGDRGAGGGFRDRPGDGDLRIQQPAFIPPNIERARRTGPETVRESRVPGFRLG